MTSVEEGIFAQEARSLKTDPQEQESARQEIEGIVSRLREVEDFFKGCNGEDYKGDTIFKSRFLTNIFSYQAAESNNLTTEEEKKLSIIFGFTYRSCFQHPYLSLNRGYLHWTEASLPLSHAEQIKLHRQGDQLGLRNGFTGEKLKDRVPTSQEIIKLFQDSYVRIIMLAIENDLEEFTKHLNSEYFIGRKEQDGPSQKAAYGLAIVFSYAQEHLKEEFKDKMPKIREMLWETMVKKILIEGFIHRDDLDKTENIIPQVLFDLINEEDRDRAHSYIEYVVTASNPEERELRIAEIQAREGLTDL